jgi:HSP20 family protein
MFPTVKRRTNDLSDVFDTFFTPSFETGVTRSFRPQVDIYEDDKAVHIEADLPGLAKKDVTVTIDKNTLVISGKRETTAESKEKGIFRSERHYGEFERRFQLGENLKQDSVEANFKDGVLTVTLPKQEEAKPKMIDVKIK